MTPPINIDFTRHRTKLGALWQVVVVMLFCQSVAFGQITGEDPPPADTLIIFTPAVPLMSEYNNKKNATNAAGLDILFSASGWGIGGFYNKSVAENTFVFFDIGLSGARNSDEVENVWLGNIPVVYGKVNRLFMVPATFGGRYRIFAESLQENFRPFLSAGLTPTMILSTPYIRDGQFFEFFNSFAYATSYFRLGGMFSLGAVFGDPSTGNVIGVQLKYYTIPFGGDGLESMAGLPITNFGGVFITMSVGSSF